MNPKQFFLLPIIVLIFSVSCTRINSENQKLTIALAANMQFAGKELVKTFSKITNIQCDIITGSSGKLTAQIKEGAPYDVFLSADMKYPLEVYNSDLSTAPPKIYGYGKLVLWSMIDSLYPTLNSLTDKSVRHIAVANPQTAPYGTAAVQTLKHYKIFNKIKDKLVYGESISQTNRFITSKSAEVGFTAGSVVLSPQMKNQGQWIPVPDSIYTSIKQGAIIIKREQKSFEKANKFYKFLFSQEAKKILKDFGYSTPLSDNSQLSNPQK